MSIIRKCFIVSYFYNALIIKQLSGISLPILYRKQAELTNQCHFNKQAGHILYGHNDVTLEGVTLEECQDQCLFQFTFQCLSFDYVDNTQVCYLSADSHVTSPDSFGSHWEADYYHKVCDDTPEPKHTDQCPDGYFQCKDNQVCITSDLVCSGEPECWDGSDEQGCHDTDTCWNNEFHCPGSDICIHELLVCNGASDCPQGKDEVDCEETCGQGYFTCQDNKQCVKESQVCDHVTNCDDGTDESDCDYHCNAGEMKCKGLDQCLPSWWKCDGEADCPGGTDELNCNPDICKDGQYQCKDTNKCILKTKVCNGQPDCMDASDEDGCNNVIS